MAVESRAVTVATTATRLDAVAEDRNAGSAFAVYNNGAATVYLGGSDVTTANGVPVPAASWGPSFTLDDVADEIWGIVASGTVEVRVIESGV